MGNSNMRKVGGHKYSPTPYLLSLFVSPYDSRVLYRGKVVIGYRLDPHPDVIRSLSNPSWDNMRVGAADVPVRIVLMTKTE